MQGRPRQPAKGDQKKVAAVACPSYHCKAKPGQRCRRKRDYGAFYYDLAWNASHRPRLVAAGLLDPLCPSCSQPLPKRAGLQLATRGA